jgi:hypothetical protein
MEASGDDSGNVKKIKARGEQGSTTSLKAAVKPGHWLWSLTYNNMCMLLLSTLYMLLLIEGMLF